MGAAAAVSHPSTPHTPAGGPLEPSRRKPMIPVLYAEVAAWFLLLAFTAFCTYVVASPNVDSLCW